MFGWDALDQWGRQSVSAINAVIANQPYEFEYIHPETGYWVTVVDYAVANFLRIPGKSLLTLSALILMFLSSVRFCVSSAQLNLTTAVLISAAVWFVPYFSNVMLIFGYVDIWVTYSIFVFLYSSHAVLERGVNGYLPVVALSMMLPMQIKDSAFLLSMAMAGSYALVLGVKHMTKNTVYVAALVVAATVAYLFFIDGVIDWRDYGIPFRLDFERNLINVGDRGERLVFNDAANVFGALYHAHGVNQSLSVTLFAVALVLTSVSIRIFENSFLLLASLVLAAEVLYLLSALYLSDYVFLHSTPQNDTALTRFSIYMLSPILFIVAVACGEIKREQATARDGRQ